MVRLNRLAVEGLFSYAARQEVEFSDRTVIVGPNNSGKSNLFRAIGTIADALLRDRGLPPSGISRPGANPRIEADLSLSPDEIGVLAVFFSCRRADEADSRAKMISGPNVEKLRGRMGDITITIEWKRMQDGSVGGPDAEVLFPACGFGLRGGTASNVLRVVPIGAVPRRRTWNLAPFNTFMNEILESGDPRKEAGQFLRSKDAVHHGVELGARGEGDRALEEMERLMRRLGRSGGTVSLTRLLGMLLEVRTVHAAEDRYLPRENVVETFERLALYPGEPDGFEFKYNRALAHGLRAQVSARSPMIKNYENFVEQFFSALADPYDDSEIERYNVIKKRFERLFQDRGLGLELITESLSFKRPRDGREQFPIRRIMVVDKARLRLPLDRVGAGARGVLYLLAAVYGARESVVMLDEPGINLHPTMLQKVVDGMDGQDSGNQILVITHSPDLLRCEMARSGTRIVRVANTNGQSRIYQDTDKTGKDAMDPRGIARIIDPAVFFAKLAVVVEGESDRAVLGLADRMAVKEPKYDLPLNNIAVVGVCGKYGFARCRSLLDKYGIPWIILADEDAKDRFEHYKASWISGDGVEGDGPVFLLKGDLEKFMEEADPDTFAESKQRSKVATALEWAARTLEKNPDGARLPMAEFLDRCLSAASRG